MLNGLNVFRRRRKCGPTTATAAAAAVAKSETTLAPAQPQDGWSKGLAAGREAQHARHFPAADGPVAGAAWQPRKTTRLVGRCWSRRRSQRRQERRRGAGRRRSASAAAGRKRGLFAAQTHAERVKSMMKKQTSSAAKLSMKPSFDAPVLHWRGRRDEVEPNAALHLGPS